MPDIYVNYTGLVNRTVGNIDRTITSLSGSSQTLMAANPLRNRIIIKNGGAACAINLSGGTAAIGGAGCITLQPFEAFTLSGRDCPQTTVTVIGTAANYVNALEGL